MTLDLARRHELTGPQTLVLMALAEATADSADGVARPSISRLAARRALETLEELGLIIARRHGWRVVTSLETESGPSGRGAAGDERRPEAAHEVMGAYTDSPSRVPVMVALLTRGDGSACSTGCVTIRQLPVFSPARAT